MNDADGVPTGDDEVSDDDVNDADGVPTGDDEVSNDDMRLGQLDQFNNS